MLLELYLQLHNIGCFRDQLIACDTAEWSLQRHLPSLLGTSGNFQIVKQKWLLHLNVNVSSNISTVTEYYIFYNYRREPRKLLLTGKFPERPPILALKAYREDRIKTYTAGGVLNSNGDDWWGSRSKVQQPLLKTKNIANYVPVIGDTADSFVERIRLIRQENNEVKADFLNKLYRWALESVGVVAFDTKLGCLDPRLAPDSEAQRVIDAVSFSFTAMSELELSAAFWKYYKTKKVKKLYEAQDFLTDTAIKYIKLTIERINKRAPDSDEDSSILEEILQRGMSPQDAVATITDLLMAGIDTTIVNTYHHIPCHLEEYFPRAKEFIPERWIKGHPLESKHHPFTLLPFGFGTRMCVGRRIAELEMKQLTAKVVQNFEIQYHHEDIGPSFRLSVGPDKPLRFCFIDLQE